jgi:hypothetical protein
VDKDKFIEIQFYDTYYFTNLVHNVVSNSTTYLRGLEGFFGDYGYQRLLEPFPKFSRLHEFIKFITMAVMYEELDDTVVVEVCEKDNENLWANQALERHGIPHISLDEWLAGQGLTREDLENEDSLVDYYTFLYDEGSLETLFNQLAEEVFFVLFPNRKFLSQFNQLLSFQILDTYLDDLEDSERKYFRRDGVLKRVAIPVWVKKAVYFRDRGMCSLCRCDLSGLVSIQNKLNYDHIVPLALGGINDVTNVQLLCNECNTQKSHYSSATSKVYERWYI